jgi:hypothetical protein
MRLRQRAPYVLAAILVIAVGLLTRWPAISIPPALAKYLGSVLWGAMVYCALRACWPDARPRIVVVIAIVLAAGVEVSQLWHTPWLDAFRRTTIGVLLIGRYFALADIAAYSAGILLARGAECAVRRA